MKLPKSINEFFKNTNESIKNLNNSKIFAGLMIITLNIASRFVPMKLSKTMESYLKNTFSKQILVFAIAWMGTRDIYIALIIVFFFTLFMDYLFNEDSMFCCLPESFINHQAEVEENNEVSDDEIKKAKEVLDKAEKQKKDKELDNTMDVSKFNSLSLV
tara:strand:+ start:698 stop:1174 length:477 start_codon:yes stop_codon:yes gene_type:complete